MTPSAALLEIRRPLTEILAAHPWQPATARAIELTSDELDRVATPAEAKRLAAMAAQHRPREAPDHARPETLTPRERIVLIAMRATSSPQTVAELMSATGRCQSLVTCALRLLVDRKLVKRRGSGRGGKPSLYWLAGREAP